MLSVELVGYSVLIYSLYHVAFWIYANFVRKNTLSAYKFKDTWAIVTGGSDGIGLAFAKRLAHRGFHVLITGRNEQKLAKVCEGLKGQYKKSKFEYVVSDAADVSMDNVKKVVTWCTGKDVGVLVNNVGVHQGGPLPFQQVQQSRIVDSLNINCVYPSLLTSEMLNEHMLTRTTAPRSLIVNLSSVVGCSNTIPSMSVYAATKAYNHFFSLALSSDLFDKKIDVLCVNPGLTSSNMTKMEASLVCSSAEECAEGALNKAGLVDVIPHWKHGIMYVMMLVGDWIPAVPRTFILNLFNRNVKFPVGD